MASREVFPKVITLLENRGFVTKKIIKSRGKRNIPEVCYSFGPAGTIVKRNVVQAWWENTVIGKKNTFPVESCFTSQNADVPSLIKEHFLPLAQLVGYRLPFSIAQVESRSCDIEDQGDKFLFDSNEQTNLMLHQFCDPQKTTQIFDRLLLLKLQWWQQFACNPKNFIVTDIETHDNGNSTACVQYQFPWGPDTLETIHRLDSNPFREVNEGDLNSFMCKSTVNSVLPSVISCCATLEKGFLAYILDALTETEVFTIGDKHTKTSHMQIQLHPYLAPYKISVVSRGKSRGLQELMDHISLELRHSGTATLSLQDLDEETGLDEQFARNDELGIPYTVIIDDASLETGIIHIRNRDTSLQEGTHISKLNDFVTKNISTH